MTLRQCRHCSWTSFENHHSWPRPALIFPLTMKHCWYLSFNCRWFWPCCLHCTLVLEVKSDVKKIKASSLIIQWIHQVFKRTVSILQSKVYYFWSSTTWTPLVFNILIIVHCFWFCCCCHLFVIVFILCMTITLTHVRMHTQTHTPCTPHTHAHTYTHTHKRHTQYHMYMYPSKQKTYNACVICNHLITTLVTKNAATCPSFHEQHIMLMQFSYFLIINNY